jgi:hypothetical protein
MLTTASPESRVARLHAADAALWAAYGGDRAAYLDALDAVVMGEVGEYAGVLPPLARAIHEGRLGVG